MATNGGSMGRRLQKITNHLELISDVPWLLYAESKRRCARLELYQRKKICFLHHISTINCLVVRLLLLF